MTAPVELDAERIFDVLARHAVHYVVIGGFAAVLHGLARATEDVDITPATEPDNLERLAAALIELDARLLVPDRAEPPDMRWSAESFASFTTMTRTSAGDLDLCLRPDRPGGRTFGYDDLAIGAVVLELDVPISVAGLADVIASKEAANRDKDRRALPELRDLLVYLTTVPHPSAGPDDPQREG